MDRGTTLARGRKSAGRMVQDTRVVVNKPAGVLMHPSHYEQSGTLLNGLTFHVNRDGGRFIRPGLPHRLDKQTWGLIVAAKTARAHRTISNDFMKNRVQKRYLALVEGVATDDDGVIDADR